MRGSDRRGQLNGIADQRPMDAEPPPPPPPGQQQEPQQQEEGEETGGGGVGSEFDGDAAAYTRKQSIEAAGAVLFIGGKRVPASTLAAGAASVLLLFVVIVVAVASSAPSAPRGPADGSSAVSADTAAPTSYVSICGKTDEESTCPRNFRCL